MTKTSNIMERALRKIGVVSETEVMTGDQFTHAIETLNSMIHAWELEGVDLDWTDLTGNEDFPLAAKYHEGVVYLLADRLSPDYEIPRSFDADRWFRSIQAANVVIPTVTMPKALQIMPSQNQYGLSDDA
jgi:hypothetical protein